MAHGFNEDKTEANIEEIAAEAVAGKVDKVAGKGLSDNNFTNSEKAIVSNFTAQLAGKVDKVTGKGLSTNDFTNAYKTKVDEAAFNTFDGSSVVLASNGSSDYQRYTCPHDGYIQLTMDSTRNDMPPVLWLENSSGSTLRIGDFDGDLPIFTKLYFVKKGTVIADPTAYPNTSIIYYPLTSYT